MIDNVFGELIYKGGWSKEDSISFWGKDINVRVIVSAYETETPNEAQQHSYSYLKENLQLLSEKTLKALKDYMEVIEDDIKAYTNIDKLPSDVNELVEINEIMFTESGSIGILCNTKWDSHGIAVLCKNDEITVGEQDIVWFD
jgi:hypothetical protein